MRTFGSLAFDAEKRQWVVTAEPQVVMRMKRVFGKLASSSKGEHCLSDSPENARDLEWFIARYPLLASADTMRRLERQSKDHVDLQSLTEALLAGRVKAEDIPLAVPLREYQKTFVAISKALKRVLLCDDVGIGKTASAIGTLVDPDNLPALVVTLTALPRQWENEIRRFAPHLRTHILKSTTPYDLASDGRAPDVIITSYSKIAGWGETLAGAVRKVVLDEVQELRKAGTMKYQAAQRVCHAADRVSALSATPIYNEGSEIHSIIEVVKPGALGDRAEFVREWCNQGYVDRERIADPKAFGMYMRDSGLMVRRTRSEVGRELPKLTRVPHTVDADLRKLDEVSKSCRELALFILGRGASPLKLQGDARKGERMLASEELSNKLRQATGIAKAPYVAEFVRMLVEQGEKVLLYGWHREFYRIVNDRLKDLIPVMYTGSESPIEKDKAKAAFVSGESKVLVMSLRSGAGLDGLQFACRTIVFGELDWSYGVHEQAEGRVQRDGQPDPVVAYYLNADHGSDPIVMDTLGIKRMQLEGIIDPMGATFERLQADPDRIRNLAEAYLRQAA